MSKRAKVIFTNGFHIGPTVETTTENLKERLERVARKHREGPPGLAVTDFIVQSYATRIPVSATNTPEGRSFGSTRSMIERPEFWPGAGEQGGVFFVILHKQPRVEFWGGTGFDDTPEFTAAIPQVMKLDED